jgi:hypothetical protein
VTSNRAGGRGNPAVEGFVTTYTTVATTPRHGISPEYDHAWRPSIRAAGQGISVGCIEYVFASLS